jgi:4-hydroxy-tetrahydrodipicolinate reductase
MAGSKSAKAQPKKAAKPTPVAKPAKTGVKQVNLLKTKDKHSATSVAKKPIPQPVPVVAAKPEAPKPVPGKLAPAKPTVAKPPLSKPIAAVAKPAPAQPATGSRPKRSPNGAIKVGVAGCAGRMGQMLLKLLISAPGVLVVGGTERRGSHVLGQDLGAIAGTEPLGITVSDNAEPLFEQADVVVDFTNPAATVNHAHLAAKSGCAHVIGTTGLDGDQLLSIGRAAQRTPVILAANMSLGVNLLEQVVEEVARILDTEWDIEVIEMHHRHKVDAPSGTALALGEAAARGRGVQLRRVARRSRDGHVGPRVRGEIGFAALRGGDVVGDHTVIFAADGERVEITHKASSREIFARGAMKAVLWSAGKKPGLYSMKDVLGFSVAGNPAGTAG